MSHKILVVEDNPITRKLLRITLQGDGYAVLEAHDGRTALDLVNSHDDIDLVLQDLLLPDMHGVELVQVLRKIPGYDSKPIIAVTGLISKLEEAHSIKSGFTAYLSKPIEPSRLLETVQTYLPKIDPMAEKPGRNRRVLLVNDDPIGLKLEKFHLEGVGFEVNAVDNAERALDIAQSSPPDAIVTDLVMPGVNGLELAMLVRKHPRLRNIPVIVNSATYTVIDQQDLRAAKDMGADDFVLRTPDLDHVIAALLKALSQKQKARPVRNAAALLLKFNRRLIHQLEIQAAQRALELRRCALETAKLSVLTGVAEMLNQQLGVDSVLEEALARTLDASGVSTGAIYLKGEDGEFRLKTQSGFANQHVEKLAELCGDKEILGKVFQQRKGLLVSAAKLQRGGLADLIARGFATSFVLVPLIAANEPLGILLASAKRELVETWLDLAAAVGAQLAQAVLLSRTLTRVSNSEQRFRELAVNINEIFFIISPDGKQLHYVSQAYETIFGRERKPLYRDARVWISAVHPEDRQLVAEAYGTQLESFNEEYRIVRPDGELRWLYARSFPVKDGAGDVLRIVGLAEDITVRKRAERKSQENLERIRALHEIDSAISSTLDLRAVLNVLLEKVDIFLPHHAATVSLYSQVTQQLDVVASRNFDEAAWKNHSSQPDHRRTYAWTVFNSGKPLAVRDIRKDPQTRHREFLLRQDLLSFVGVPLIVKGEALGVLTLYSKEERQFSAEEIEFLSTLAGQAAIAIHNAQLYAQMVKANQVKHEFLSVMSHELRTPLSVILGYAGLIKDRVMGDLTDLQEDALKKILGHAGEQLALINDIMQTTQLDSRAAVAENLPVNLRDLMNQLSSDFALQTRKEAVQLVWNYPDGPMVITTDASKLMQILRNLVGNAIKFTDEGTITVSARAVSPSPDSCFVEFKVADTGIGIQADKLGAIFEQFYQVDSSATRLYGGVGIGLYICKKFTELLGGRIDVGSEVGKGSTFVVKIPRQSQPAKKPGQDAEYRNSQEF